MKKIIKKIFSSFGLKISRINNEISEITFDDIYKKHLKKNSKPIIFDIGGNQGQSIDRFKKIFPNSIIHSFEPITKEFASLKKKYSKENDIFINNLAIGNEKGEKKFNVSLKSGASSFNKINLNTKWIKKRAKQYKSSEDNFSSEQIVKIDKLDNYCKENNISCIDILKIDTQGYEDEVIKGSTNLLLSEKISAIELEIIFDDVYNKSFSFIDIEKHLIDKNMRFCGIDFANNNLFSGLVFFANALYINKKKIIS